MSPRLGWVPALAVLLLAGPQVPAAAPPVVTQPLEAQALARKIDEHIAQRWAETKAKPAPLADDAEFVRRLYLDLAGRIPTVAETRMFLRDRRPNKRALLVEQLLAGSRYSAHLTNIWRALLIPEAGNNFQVRLSQNSFEAWLKERATRNTGYDQMVRELLTARIAQGGRGNPFGNLGAPSAAPFYLAKELKPENLAAGTARAFLGVSVECAQCHNHPFAEWKREQFWGFAAFFAGVKSQRTMDFLIPNGEDATKRELAIPGTDKIAQARFLDGTEPTWRPGVSACATLAAWITSPANPYFSRAAVNRSWAYFLGTGLVEPIDELVGPNSTPSHPELLDLLARQFAANKFDVKYLIRTITATRAYQLSSVATHVSQNDPTLFARMPLRGLTAEQLFDSLATATGYRDSGGGDDLLTGLLGGKRSARSEFLTKFAQSERAVEAQTSILQALTLMNGKVIADATSLNKSETLAAIVDAPFMTAADCVKALYFATLSREPNTRENARALRFIEDAVKRARPTTAHARKAAASTALADVFWALLNSPEFVLNH